MPEFEAIKRAIRQRHLDQLRDFDIVADPYENSPTRASVYNDLVKWTETSKAQMAYGKAHSEPQTFKVVHCYEKC